MRLKHLRIFNDYYPSKSGDINIKLVSSVTEPINNLEDNKPDFLKKRNVLKWMLIGGAALLIRGPVFAYDLTALD